MVEVHVRPYPRARKRFPLTTPIPVMVAWRSAKFEALTVAKRDRAKALEAGDTLTADALREADANTLRQDVEIYLQHKIDPTLHPCTKTQFTRWLRQAAGTELGRYPRHLVTGAMWTKLVALWERTGVPSNEAGGGRRRLIAPGPLAVDTVHKIRTCFIGFYRAMDVGLDVPNPAKLIPRRQTSDPEPRGIAMAQALLILKHVGRSGAPTRTGARLMLMCVLGLRPVEIMRIRPATDWHKTQQQLTVRTAKGGKARTLPLGDRATAALELLDRLKGWGTFTSAPAARMFHDAVKAAKLTELEPLRPYDLRHTFGTEVYRQTKDIKATGAAMGHKNLSQTERYVEASVSETVANLFTTLEQSMPKLVKTKRRGKLHAV